MGEPLFSEIRPVRVEIVQRIFSYLLIAIERTFGVAMAMSCDVEDPAITCKLNQKEGGRGRAEQIRSDSGLSLP